MTEQDLMLHNIRIGYLTALSGYDDVGAIQAISLTSELMDGKVPSELENKSVLDAKKQVSEAVNIQRPVEENMIKIEKPKTDVPHPDMVIPKKTEDVETPLPGSPVDQTLNIPRRYEDQVKYMENVRASGGGQVDLSDRMLGESGGEYKNKNQI